MFHPLFEDPTLLKDAELEAKILDLGKKYHIASRMGQGAVCEQIWVILAALKEEQQKRSRAMLQKTQVKQDKSIDDLININ